MRIYTHHACHIKRSKLLTKDRSQRITISKKAARKRASVKRRSRRDPDRFCAYVGNLHPFTTIEEITDLFQHCDGLVEIRLRIGHGFAVYPSRHMLISDLDVQFATVQVSEWNGLVQAMKMNGSYLAGRRLVVGLTTAALPEMDRLLYEQFHGAGAVQRNFGSLRAEATEIIPEEDHREVIIWSRLSTNMPVSIM
ncbi:hypothetical protein D9757_000082 [Collybiopsis confluens]|uniref:RRM domain-containing protein n=1 Tax=Collybiopsis confluens TaxID=2823264 RepID=A0A8H5I2H2_9AGAR|nr:hypothetical protein D9757_000082 [Collybiopsis confluens]